MPANRALSAVCVWLLVHRMDSSPLPNTINDVIAGADALITGGSGETAQHLAQHFVLRPKRLDLTFAHHEHMVHTRPGYSAGEQ